MLIRKCDRCSETIEKNFWEINIIQKFEMMPNITVEKKELCDRCRDELINFLNTY